MKNKIKFYMLEIPRPFKRFVVVLNDCCLAIFSVWLSYYLRIGDFIPLLVRANEHYALPAYIVGIIIFIPIFLFFKLYKEIFHYFGTETLITIIKAMVIYASIYSLIFTFISVDGVPRTIGIIQPVVFMLLIIFSRYFVSFWLGGLHNSYWKQRVGKRALIFGAGEKGQELMKAFSNIKEISIVGFLDDDPKLYNNKVSGLNIYNAADIKKIISKKEINEIILILNQISIERRKDILKLVKDENITVRTLPSYSDIANGKISINHLNYFSISDILGRNPIKPIPKLIQHDITDKVILVSGAGGSIGSEICRQIHNQRPQKIVLVEQSEFALYNILENLKKLSYPKNNPIEIVPRLGSVTNKIFIKQILKEIKPETIFHAAAYKHVPLVESNILEGINNNVIGTLILAEEAISNGVKKFVFISSDKAVRPKNIMGASKRLAEMVLQALTAKQKQTNFAIVRFGNVLDSSGSVVPLFKSQIRVGGPLTVTDLDMKRYFMTISEAAELVIQAGAMIKSHKKNNASSPIYILDMGEPVRIYDLARLMINMSGLNVYNKDTNKGDIEIKIIGSRPGEKLYEELLIGDTISDTIHPKIKCANEDFLPWPQLNANLLDISQAIKNNNQKLLIQLLENLVDGFRYNPS